MQQYGRTSGDLNHRLARKYFKMHGFFTGIFVNNRFRRKSLMDEAFAYVINRTASLSPWVSWRKLTKREKEIAKIICQVNGGRLITNPQIADKLGISRETVKIHIRNILYKFDLHSKSELRQTLISWEIVRHP